MADRMRVTSVILSSLPRGERLVLLVGGRKLARFGGIDRGHKPQMRNLRRSDTPTAIWFFSLRASVSSTRAQAEGRSALRADPTAAGLHGIRKCAQPSRSLVHTGRRGTK